MKQDKEKFEKHLKRVFDSLIGDIEEVDLSEAGQLLQSAGIDYESVRRKMYDKLAQSAMAFRLEQKSVPVDLQQALEAFRPPDAPPRNEEEARQQAHGIISGFLGRAGAPPSLRFALSYRNRGELTEVDIKVLDSAVNKLKKKLGQRE